MATVRSRRVSRARYTSPIPPAPSGPTTSYGPSLVPGTSAIIGRDYNPGSFPRHFRRLSCPTSKSEVISLNDYSSELGVPHVRGAILGGDGHSVHSRPTPAVRPSVSRHRFRLRAESPHIP